MIILKEISGIEDKETKVLWRKLIMKAVRRSNIDKMESVILIKPDFSYMGKKIIILKNGKPDSCHIYRTYTLKLVVGERKDRDNVIGTSYENIYFAKEFFPDSEEDIEDWSIDFRDAESLEVCSHEEIIKEITSKLVSYLEEKTCLDAQQLNRFRASCEVCINKILLSPRRCKKMALSFEGIT
jgi:hypothetical protein